MNPSKYCPKSPSEFVGPARQIAQILDRVVADSKPTGDPIKILLNGPPGTGKTTLANYLHQRIGSSKWSTLKLNGTSLKIEQAEEIARSLQFTSMFPEYRYFQIEEADKMSAQAQVRLLTIIDDLPQNCAIVCTSNCQIDQFEERFQTRFQAFEVLGPEPDEIEALLLTFLGHAPALAKHLAVLCCGNVRQALLEAQTALQSERLAA